MAKKFVVVAPERLVPDLVDFIEFKRQQMPTVLVELESILQAVPGVDDSEKLKKFLYEQWKHEQLGYVLLVGDGDIMPIRYMVLDRVTEPAYHYAFYPSDLYYSDLARSDGSFESWNGNQDGFHATYFGEVRGEANKSDPINFDRIDYLPDVAVGRWPVSNSQELKSMVQKSIKYEHGITAESKAGYRTAGLVSVGGWVDSRPTMKDFASKLGTSWNIKNYFYGPNRDTKILSPTESNLIELFNSGAGFIVHAGHGRDDGWEECLSISAFNRIQNDDRLPIVISAGCSTARFSTLPPYEPYIDISGNEHVGTNFGEVFSEPPPAPQCYQPGKYNPTGLGEYLLRNGPHGAIAYIGCNTGSQPCGLRLIGGFAETYRESHQSRLGDCWRGAVKFYFHDQGLAQLQPNDDWYPPSIFFQAMKFMCFGDPTLPLPARQD